jgi:hypothetical protein
MQAYIFFSEQMLVLASHTPPAFWQSASVFAAVTSPAKAGPVKASARVIANIEMRAFMTFQRSTCPIDAKARPEAIEHGIRVNAIGAGDVVPRADRASFIVGSVVMADGGMSVRIG